MTLKGGKQSDADLTNVQWANRFGKGVFVRTSHSVTGGLVNGVDTAFVLVGPKRIPRQAILKVRDVR